MTANKNVKLGRPRIPAPELEALSEQSDEPIDRQVYDTIKRALMSGAIPPGGKLSSRSIAGALGVSPMPVREALKRLDADGVLSSTAKTAFVVKELTKVEYEEILSIRFHLEGAAIRAATGLITAKEIDQAYWLYERINAARDWKQVLHYNYKMHFLIYGAANLPFTLKLIENTWLRVGPALHRVNDFTGDTAATSGGSKSEKEHADLLEALRFRNPEAAEQALRTDMEGNAKVMFAYFKQNAEQELVDRRH